MGIRFFVVTRTIASHRCKPSPWQLYLLIITAVCHQQPSSQKLFSGDGEPDLPASLAHSHRMCEWCVTVCVRVCTMYV